MLYLFRYLFLAICTIGLVLLVPSCQKDGIGDIDKPDEVIDSSTIHVYGQHIDSGFVFGRWTMVCYHSLRNDNSGPIQTTTEVIDCTTRPVYEFKPNGLLYTYSYSSLGDTTVFDSAIYWYQGSGSLLWYISYLTEESTDGSLQYQGFGPLTEQSLTYRNDSMFWRENSGGTTVTTRSFVLKD